MMRREPANQLPLGLTHYKSTPLFDAGSTPLALQCDHSTKSDVWGRIQVRNGRLRYTISDPGRTASTIELTANDSRGIIEPTVLHRVELIGDVEFQVEFWR